jgi:hypothetical protein
MIVRDNNTSGTVDNWVREDLARVGEYGIERANSDGALGE